MQAVIYYQGNIIRSVKADRIISADAVCNECSVVYLNNMVVAIVPKDCLIILVKSPVK